VFRLIYAFMLRIYYFLLLVVLIQWSCTQNSVKDTLGIKPFNPGIKDSIVRLVNGERITAFGLSINGLKEGLWKVYSKDQLRDIEIYNNDTLKARGELSDFDLKTVRISAGLSDSIEASLPRNWESINVDLPDLLAGVIKYDTIGFFNPSVVLVFDINEQRLSKELYFKVNESNLLSQLSNACHLETKYVYESKRSALVSSYKAESRGHDVGLLIGLTQLDDYSIIVTTGMTEYVDERYFPFYCMYEEIVKSIRPIRSSSIGK
jgi:hypothetical protein